jgi:hypothetical protein
LCLLAHSASAFTLEMNIEAVRLGNNGRHKV